MIVGDIAVLESVFARTRESVHWEGVASWRRNWLLKSSFEGVTWKLIFIEKQSI